ncbi:MAG: hypothetical protein ABEJ62_01160 [Candidatus Nanohaloarchaea archaeon]
MDNRKGQAAIEYLAIVGLVLLFATPLLIRAQTSAGDLRRTADMVAASNALDTVSQAASFVYSQGEPARITFRVSVPSGVNLSNVTGNYIHFQMDGSHGGGDLYEILEFNVTGDIPPDRGVYTMVAEAVGENNVSIHEK